MEEKRRGGDTSRQKKMAWIGSLNGSMSDLHAKEHIREVQRLPGLSKIYLPPVSVRDFC